MKMLILFPLISISLAIVILAGCDDSIETKTVVRKTYEIGEIVRVTIDGHDYLVRNDVHRGGICHDENCQCKTNLTSKTGNN